MRPRINPCPDLLALADRQAGVISREQALGLGMPPSSLRRLVNQGHWTRLKSGLFCLGPVTARSWLWGGLITAGPLSVVTGPWALHLDEIVAEPPLPVHILSPQRCPDTDEWRFVRRQSRGRKEPSRAPVEVSLLDAWPHMTEPDFIQAVSEVLHRRSSTLQRIADEAEGRARIPRRRELLDCLGDMGDGVRSTLEADYLRLVERPHGLPTGRRQAAFQGRPLDIAYDGYGVVVETDGRRGHVGVGAFRDMERDNALAAEGFLVLRFGWSDTRKKPCAVARQVAEALLGRGWAGPFAPCPSCP